MSSPPESPDPDPSAGEISAIADQMIYDGLDDAFSDYGKVLPDAAPTESRQPTEGRPDYRMNPNELGEMKRLGGHIHWTVSTIISFSLGAIFGGVIIIAATLAGIEVVGGLGFGSILLLFGVSVGPLAWKMPGRKNGVYVEQGRDGGRFIVGLQGKRGNRYPMTEMRTGVQKSIVFVPSSRGGGHYRITLSFTLLAPDGKKLPVKTISSMSGGTGLAPVALHRLHGNWTQKDAGSLLWGYKQVINEMTSMDRKGRNTWLLGEPREAVSDDGASLRASGEATGDAQVIGASVPGAGRITPKMEESVLNQPGIERFNQVGEGELAQTMRFDEEQQIQFHHAGARISPPPFRLTVVIAADSVRRAMIELEPGSRTDELLMILGHGGRILELSAEAIDNLDQDFTAEDSLSGLFEASHPAVQVITDLANWKPLQ